AGKINIYQHIEDLKNSLTIESLNEDLNLKKKSCKFLEIIIIVFRIQVL
ncbi:TPA: 3-hydroxyacyl-CoA dehydrogenase, partial [Campylobacter coli]|nr:3-hydroxyacyl-CoA dehydrogenase [Campylobacter coli]